MGFIGVAKAIYDFQPSGEGELEIKQGNLLYILEKDTGDAWWKAKKRATEDDEDEPEGLVPNNYVEEVRSGSRDAPRAGLTVRPGTTGCVGEGAVRLRQADRRGAVFHRGCRAAGL